MTNILWLLLGLFGADLVIIFAIARMAGLADRWMNEIRRNEYRVDPGEMITDGWSYWSKRCPKCDELTMVIVRPGLAVCADCGYE